ncbi:CDP-alcohol phosphatidyltransferase family protein [Solemya velesiana gill symbiont]|uniref:CDP-diacylglycerol--glycerol-3-phosphate 3-phosphatidyltransferase n=1 Tax=Solemya velesiana gill symbiont TaxID=1918948 RepID=A0A1T2KPQ5_9GAMM|nr:CDP-alcohol phosphatidyltransferase family protein [Solemya velesiana gill symbiont]OOZ34761.1 CDP-alcohol phosphatidyltransferase [Solemya velesiana gill symbiont]
MTREDIPNLISVLRIFLTIPVVWMLLEQQFEIALVLFFVAGVSDGLDGYLAKHYGWTSRLGGLLDPLADKVLLVSSYLSLAVVGMIPVWLVMLVILRDLVIVTGALVYSFRVEELEAEPSMISKVNTVTQIVLVLSVVLDEGLLALPSLFITIMIWAVAVTTVASGADYVWVWSRRAARQGKK